MISLSQNGMKMVSCKGDLSETGKVLSQKELQRMHNLGNINILNYYRIKLLVGSFMKKYVQVTKTV